MHPSSQSRCREQWQVDLPAPAPVKSRQRLPDNTLELLHVPPKFAAAVLTNLALAPLAVLGSHPDGRQPITKTPAANADRDPDQAADDAADREPAIRPDGSVAGFHHPVDEGAHSHRGRIDADAVRQAC